MAVAVRDVASAAPGGTPCAVTLPATIEAGDLIVLTFATQTGNTVSTSGITGLTQDVSSTAGSGLFVAWHKVAVSGDAGASVSIAYTGVASKSAAMAVAFSGVDGTTPIDDFDKLPETTSGISHATPSLTTTVDDAMILLACMQRDSSSAAVGSAPPGYTQTVSAVGTGGGHVIGTGVVKTAGTAGSYGGESLSFDAASAAALSWAYALTPATETPPPPSSGGMWGVHL